MFCEAAVAQHCAFAVDMKHCHSLFMGCESIK